MSHFEASSLETTLEIETLVGLTAIKNTLVAADLFSHKIQSLDHLQSQLLSLLILSDGDILDVAYEPEVVNAIEHQYL